MLIKNAGPVMDPAFFLDFSLHWILMAQKFVALVTGISKWTHLIGAPITSLIPRNPALLANTSAPLDQEHVAPAMFGRDAYAARYVADTAAQLNPAIRSCSVVPNMVPVWATCCLEPARVKDLQVLDRHHHRVRYQVQHS
jgi:hypothetical protein